MYDILSSRSKAKLLAMVNERLADGWKLVGGHTHVVYEEEMDSYDSEPILRTTGCWSQAMELDADFGYSSIVFRGNIYPENKYELSAVFNITESGDIYFNLVAERKGTEKWSTINTVNGILSSLGISNDDSRSEIESDWEIQKCEFVKFKNLIDGLAISRDFALYNEILDEDYALGGWNSNSKED